VKELYIGNLLFSVTLDEVRDLFVPFGTVYDAKLVAERAPERPHAFAFVEMQERAADEAIQALDGSEFMGLTLRVEEAKPDTGLSVEPS
jgi:RNA recognition motif-containing protein